VGEGWREEGGGMRAEMVEGGGQERRVEVGGSRLEGGGRRVENGGWREEDGGRRMEGGGGVEGGMEDD
jgi:hypothetical protein